MNNHKEGCSCASCLDDLETRCRRGKVMDDISHFHHVIQRLRATIDTDAGTIVNLDLFKKNLLDLAEEADDEPITVYVCLVSAGLADWLARAIVFYLHCRI